MMRFIAANPGPPPTGWSADQWDTFRRLQRQRKVLLADAHQGPERATAELVRGISGLEDMPIPVLTHGRAVDAQFKGGWVDLQRRFAETCRRSRQILVATGHGVPVDAPGVVIEAVQEIVTTVRAPRH